MTSTQQKDENVALLVSGNSGSSPSTTSRRNIGSAQQPKKSHIDQEAEEQEIKERKVPYGQKLVETAVLMGITAAILYYTDTWIKLRTLPWGISFYITALSASGVIGIYLYLAMYLDRIKGIRVNYEAWETELPQTIRAVTILSMITFIGCWAFMSPIYYILTPVVLFIYLLTGISFIALF